MFEKQSRWKVYQDASLSRETKFSFKKKTKLTSERTTKLIILIRII